MSFMLTIYLYSFIPIILFSVVFWSDILNKKQFGKRPVHLFVSIALFSLIGLFVTITSYNASVFTPESSFAQFTLFTVLYLLAFFFAEYSIHSQRLVRSYFIDAFRLRMKRYLVLFSILALLSILAVIIFCVRPLLNGSIAKATGILTPFQIQQFEQTNSLPHFEFQLFNIIIFVLFSIISFAFLLTVNRTIFIFQGDVIRQNTLFLISSIVVILFFAINFILWGFFASIPLGFFLLNNLSYFFRISSEYFYQRTLNLDRKLIKQEQSSQLKNELIAQVVNSPVEEDITIIKKTAIDEIERARGLLSIHEYGITGSIIYTREGSLLKITSAQHINGVCLPILRLDTIKLYKNKEQLNEIILRSPFNLENIIATPKEKLATWGEKLIKEILVTKKELIIENIPDEIKGRQSFIALYPVFDKDYLLGLVAIFKDSFDKLFPEEENALNSLVDNLKVIFSIIQGKTIQRERNRLQGEMEIARTIQTSILPKKITIDGYECATNMVTASEVGGDVFDYCPSEHGAYLGIGDVSGHGLPAGITALIQLTAFQAAVKTANTCQRPLAPYELYDLINKILCEINRNRIGSDKFMTENYFLVKDNLFTYAGTHLIALQYSKKENTVNEIPELANRTAFMGISEHISSKNSAGQLTLQPEDILFLYTDGIIEAKDASSNQFGLPKLKQILLENSSNHLEEIIKTVMQEVHEHARLGDMKKHKGHLADDASLVLLRKL